MDLTSENTRSLVAEVIVSEGEDDASRLSPRGDGRVVGLPLEQTVRVLGDIAAVEGLRQHSKCAICRQLGEHPRNQAVDLERNDVGQILHPVLRCVRCRKAGSKT